MVKLDKKLREQYKKSILDALQNGEKEEFQNTFLELHPSDQLDIFVTLDHDARKRGYSYLTPKEFAGIFGGLNISNQKLFFLELDENYSRSEEHTSELQSRGHLVCRLLLEKKKYKYKELNYFI